MKRWALVVVFVLLVVQLSECKKGGDDDDDGDDSPEAQLAKKKEKERKARKENTPQSDALSPEDFLDNIDPTTLGRKECLSEIEVTYCVDTCEKDKDCEATSQDTRCEEDCLSLCRYIDHWNKRKCANHLISQLSWYRDFGGAAVGKTKVKPRAPKDRKM